MLDDVDGCQKPSIGQISRNTRGKAVKPSFRYICKIISCLSAYDRIRDHSMIRDES